MPKRQMGISDGEVRNLAQDGFVVLDEFLEPGLVRELIGAVESLDVDVDASRSRRGVAFARRNLLSLDFVQDLIGEPSVRELLELIAPGMVAVRAILFDKTGDANWTVPWHQDRSISVRERLEIAGFGPWSMKAGVVHVQPPAEILRGMVTLRFHLDPCTADNGPLRVIAGTHNRILEQKEVEDCVAEGEQISCIVEAGGLVVMRPLILHASSPAVCASHRRVIHVEFGPATLPGGLDWAMDRA